MYYVRCEVLGRRGDLLIGKTLEDVRDNLVKGLLVMRLQPVLVLAIELFLGHVEVKGNLLVALELHDDKRVPGLTLAQRRIQANTE